MCPSSASQGRNVTANLTEEVEQRQVSQSCCILPTFNVAWDIGVADPDVVLLNVYDVTRWRCVETYNRWVLPLGGAGAFHVAIEVFRYEYQFGFRPEGSGVTKNKPRQNANHHFWGSINLGRTQLTKGEVEEALRELAKEWRGYHYDALRHNCCNFAHVAAQRLGVKRLPDWVDRLPQLAAEALSPMDNMVSSANRLVRSVSRSMMSPGQRVAEI